MRSDVSTSYGLNRSATAATSAAKDWLSFVRRRPPLISHISRPSLTAAIEFGDTPVDLLRPRQYVFDVMICGGQLPDALREHRFHKSTSAVSIALLDLRAR